MGLLLKIVYVFHSVGQALVSSVKTYLDGISDEVLNASKKRELKSELDREKTFCIMACGVAGHGKSTLLNGIVGRDIFKQGHGTTSETSEVNEYTEHFENSSIVVLDTPGFDDTKDMEKEHLQEIRAKCKKVNTLLYCVSMMECRITSRTKEQLSSTVSKLKKILSKKIWKNCVIVLTFANLVRSRFKKMDNLQIKAHFNTILDEWKSEIQKILRAANIDNYKEIPIITTGESEEPKLHPDDEKPWLSTLWNTIYNKSPADGRAVLFHFNAGRLIDVDVSSAEHSTIPIYEQPIEVDKSFKTKLWNAFKKNRAAIATAFGVGGAGGVTGAAIGATIGALAIGLSTFGMAAGVGLVLGGLIGGGIGVTVGAAAGKTAQHVQNKKKCGQAAETDSETEMDA
jgi:GTPase SAR1 family protein